MSPGKKGNSPNTKRRASTVTKKILPRKAKDMKTSPLSSTIFKLRDTELPPSSNTSFEDSSRIDRKSPQKVFIEEPLLRHSQTPLPSLDLLDNDDPPSSPQPPKKCTVLTPDELRSLEEKKKAMKLQHQQLIESILDTEELDGEVAKNFSLLWSSSYFQRAYKKLQLRIPSQAAYYFNKVLAFSDPDYEMVHEDLLNGYFPSTGVTQNEAEVNKQHFVLFDVGGRQTEQRKWEFFLKEGHRVDVIMFVVGLDECYKMTEENPEVNVLQASTKLWGTITKKMTTTPFVLVLNKKDLFYRNLQLDEYKLLIPLEKAGNYDYDYCLTCILQNFRDSFRGCCMLEFVTNALDKSTIFDAFSQILNTF